MSPLHVARFDVALEALDLVCGCAGGWMPVTVEGNHGRERFWHRTGTAWSARRLVGLVRAVDERLSPELAFGLPWRTRDAGGVHDATVLWCRIEGKEQLRRARAFRPLPSIVLQEGASTRRLLIWSLGRPLDYFDVEQLNKRIAYRIGAVQKYANPDALWVPAPGTCLRVGRSRPIPIVVARLTTASYTPAMVAGRLKDPPEQKWWEQANG